MVVFPRDDLMTLVSQGSFGGVTRPAVNGYGARRAKQWLMTPSFVSCSYMELGQSGARDLP
jgi:hypothetical protein